MTFEEASIKIRKLRDLARSTTHEGERRTANEMADKLEKEFRAGKFQSPPVRPEHVFTDESGDFFRQSRPYGRSQESSFESREWWEKFSHSYAKFSGQSLREDNRYDGKKNPDDHGPGPVPADGGEHEI